MSGEPTRLLRTNLATRPFYNERAVHALLSVVAVLALAVTTFNVVRITTLSKQERVLLARAGSAEAKARDLRADASRTRARIDPKQLEALTTEVREANLIIDRRVFSWTELFNRFEATLPSDVRIASIRPRVDKSGAVQVVTQVIAKRAEDIDAFIENLEKQGAFEGLLSREDYVDERGEIRATLEGRYLPGATRVSSTGGRP
jgi:hypothetical protein